MRFSNSKAFGMVLSSALLVSCAQTPKFEDTRNVTNLDFIDLSNAEPEEVAKYWTVAVDNYPDAPQQAIDEKLAGCVTLFVGINEEGLLHGAQVRESYPKVVFDRAAITAMKDWIWHYAESNTQRQPVMVSVKLHFPMEGASNAEAYQQVCVEENQFYFEELAEREQSSSKS